MKKLLYILLIALTVGGMGCHRTPSGSVADLVMVDNGAMSFYDMETDRLAPFTRETDSVVNLLFTDNSHLYYTVAKNGDLFLKCLDLSDKEPEPKLCAAWNLTVEEGMNYMSDCVSDLFYDAMRQKIVIFGMDVEMGMDSPFGYDLASGEVRSLNEGESLNLRVVDANFPVGRFYTEDHLLYYIASDGKHCLNDKVDFDLYFVDEDEREDLEFTPLSSSPDGKKVVYSAVVFWGEGWGYYCVADADGATQSILGDSDVRFATPMWLSDGSLVYVGEGIKRIDPKGNVKAIGPGRTFAVRPFAEPKGDKAIQAGLEGCDAAFFDNGKLIFYNSGTNTFVPYVVETDSVINGVFVEDYSFYYTVKIGEELYLKMVYLGDYGVEPFMLTDWDLTLDDCVSRTYGKASTLVSMPSYNRVGINHNFSWDFYNFADIRFYDYVANKKLNGWSEDEETETDIFDDDFLQYEEDLESFLTFEDNYYYLSDGDPVCISDKINFEELVSDPAYYDTPEFNFYSIDPTRTKVAYCALIEWGDLGHGPLCVASLDGEMQIALKDTDASDLSYGWLSNGSLLYVGVEPRPADDPEYNPEWNTTKPCVHIVRPDGTDEVFSHATDFVVIQ